jgi:DtxR family transcriptional regulator, Mn-dependent transcriptional regulator
MPRLFLRIALPLDTSSKIQGRYHSLSHDFLIAPEMYLKTIYNLETKNGAARTGDIATILDITPGSVTNTLEVLESKGLVAREPYKGVKLTGEGLKIALSVFRRHRLAEKLLTDVLKLDWTDSHEEACKLEHVLSNNLAKAIEKTLGSPQTCPHGNPIPAEDGSMLTSKDQPLAALGNGESAVVSRIPDPNSELLRYLASLGMFPGVKIQIEEKAPFKGPILVKVGSNSYPLSLDVASCIYVSKQ